MCLAIPGKIKKIEGSSAYFNYQGHESTADVSLVFKPKIGDWILMHDGRAMSKISEEEAKENLNFIKLQEEEIKSDHTHHH